MKRGERVFPGHSSTNVHVHTHTHTHTHTHRVRERERENKQNKGNSEEGVVHGLHQHEFKAWIC